MAKPFRLKAPVASEDEFHVSVARLLTWCLAEPGVTSIRGVLWYSIEQRFKGGGAMFTGKGGQQVPVELANRARRGVVAGVPDVHLFWGAHAYLIELKRQGGRMSKAQRDLHPMYTQCGVQVARCDSLDDVVARLNFWGVPWTVRPAQSQPSPFDSGARRSESTAS